MDTKFQTSFIPKKTVVQAVSRPKTGSVSVVLLIAIIIFIFSLAAAGGVFAYKKILVGRISDMDKRLTEAKNSFEPGFIEQLRKADKRIVSASKIIAGHTAMSPIFDLLENDTLATIKFNNFNYEIKEGGTGYLSMSGEARSFTSVALQSDSFSQEKYIKNPVFSDLNPNLSGNIIFKFSGTIDPALVSYKNNIVLPDVSSEQSLPQ